MTHPEALELLHSIAKKPVFGQALRHLKSGTEIALRLDDRSEFALFFREQAAMVEERAAVTPDVEYVVSSEALRRLAAAPGENLAPFGISVLELVAAGEIKIRVPGSLWRLATAGYLQIVLAAGPELLSFLAQYGINNSKKIIDLMRSLKN